MAENQDIHILSYLPHLLSTLFQRHLDHFKPSAFSIYSTKQFIASFQSNIWLLLIDVNTTFAPPTRGQFQHGTIVLHRKTHSPKYEKEALDIHFFKIHYAFCT